MEAATNSVLSPQHSALFHLSERSDFPNYSIFNIQLSFIWAPTRSTSDLLNF